MKLCRNLGSLLLVVPALLMSSIVYGQVGTNLGSRPDCLHWGKRAEFIYNNVDARRSVGAESPVADEKRRMDFDELESGSVGFKYYSTVFDAIKVGASVEEVSNVGDAFCREFPAGTFDPDN